MSERKLHSLWKSTQADAPISLHQRSKISVSQRIQRLSSGTKSILWTLWIVLTLCTTRLHAQNPADPTLQTTTEERLLSEPWWPTKYTFPLNAYAGSAACTKCHAEEAAVATPSSMRRASTPAAEARLLKGQPSASYTAAPYTYSLAATSDGLEYSVSAGDRKLTRRLEWVMGAGDLAHTFLYRVGDRWYQSLATLYFDHAELDVTTGLSRSGTHDLESALGTELSPADTRKCFGCHTVHATTSQGFNPLHAEAGLGCEACHGPAAAHAANAKAAVFNPAKLSPSDSNDFCGACHRSSGDVNSFSTEEIASTTAVVRFQPYRLEESKCWRATQDARLTCVACHDPHQPLNRKAASYDRNCLQCHSPHAQITEAKVCPRATSQCVQCHMPKVNVASMHGNFTDHDIRVVQAGEGFLK